MDDNVLVNEKSSQSQAANSQLRPTQPTAAKRGDINNNGRSQPAEPAPLPTAPPEAKETGTAVFKEAEPRVVEKREFVVPQEVKNWVKVEKKEEITLPQPIKDEYGQILMKSAQPDPAKIFLPLTQDQTKLALKKKITESVRWLAEWCLRILKMFPKRASYKQINNNHQG